MDDYNIIFSTTVALLVLLVSAALPALIQAADAAALGSDVSASEAARIDSFEISAPDGVNMGDEVTFTVKGTPGGTASVLITGVTETIYLEEIESGVYQAGLRIHPHMNLFAHDFARATLEKGESVASADEKLPME